MNFFHRNEKKNPQTMSNCCMRRPAKFLVDIAVRFLAIANIRERVGVKRPLPGQARVKGNIPLSTFFTSAFHNAGFHPLFRNTNYFANLLIILQTKSWVSQNNKKYTASKNEVVRVRYWSANHIHAKNYITHSRELIGRSSMLRLSFKPHKLRFSARFDYK